MTARSRCLVTGGAGFIGSHICRELLDRGYGVRVLDDLSTGSWDNLAEIGSAIEFIEGDIRDPAACEKANAGVDVVFHLAALPSVPRSLADPWASHDVNVNGTMRMLEAARAKGVRRMVFSSSSSVYGDTPTLPKIEDMEPLPRSPYATSKLAGEQYVLAYARAGLLEGVALRYFNVFGPRQSPTSAYAAVIPLFLSSAQHGTVATVYGDGEQTRDFTYVDNVVLANCLAAFEPAERVSGWALNAGAGSRTSLNELLRLVERTTGSAVRREYRGPRAGDVRDSQASLDRATAVLGYRPLVALPEGLGHTWNWMSGQAREVA